ncbi:hypothetical protein PS619_00169 [Pseudomonas fluorescens]|nr:hypothetical protein PS619_00169 [Pseudomonas fluorescens]
MMRNIQTREGFEFWDKLNGLPRYAFLLSPSGTSVQKFEDQTMGNWIDVHEAQKIVDQAQDLISELRDELERQKRYVEINANSAQGKHAEGQRYRDERDALQQRLNAADQRIDELERDKARLDALDSNCWDVRFNSSPNGDAGDSSINIEVVGHWMDQPFERVIGENYSENLRAAIDQAMIAPAYPPARPEYPELDEALEFAKIQ